MLQIPLKAAGLIAATASQAPAQFNAAKFRALIVTLNVTAAERDTGNETYDIYITTGDGVASWDLIHFPQIASTGAKKFVASVVRDVVPVEVTTAAPGISSVESATLAVGAGQANVLKSLAAGVVRHGPWGDYLGVETVVAGTVATGINFSVSVTAVE